MSSESFSFEDARKPVQQSTASGQPATFSFEEATGKPPKTGGALSKLADVGLGLAQSAIAVPETAVGIADLVTGGKAGKFLANEGGDFGFRPGQAKQVLEDWKSDGLKAKKQDFQQAEGILGKVGVAVRNPSLVVDAAAQSAAPMFAGGIIGRGVLAVAPRVGAAGAGAIGEGVVGAGSAAEQIRQESADGELSAKQSGLAAASGAGTALFGALGGKVASKLGIGDVDTMITQGAAKSAGAASTRSIPRQAIEGAISEGLLEELPQSISEQIIQNLALDKPWSEGVDAAAVMGALTGAGMGGAASGLSGFAGRRPSGAGEDAPDNGPNAPVGPTVDPARLSEENAARLSALEDQEIGDPQVPQSAAPDGRAILNAQRDANRAELGPDDEIYQSTGANDPRRPIFANPADTIAARLKPSELMGLNPAAGALSREVAAFVDATSFTEVTPIEQRTGIGAQRRLSEQPIIDVDAREVIDPQQTIAARLAGPSQTAPIQQAVQQLSYNPATQGDSLADQAPQAIQAATQRTQAGAAQAEPALIEASGQAWDSYSTEQRAAVARSAGVRGAMSRSVAAKGWGDLSPNLRASIAASIQPSGLPWGASNVGNASTPQPLAVSGREGSGNLLAQGQRGTRLSGNGDGVRGGSDGARSGVTGSGAGEAGLAPLAGRAGAAPALTQGVAPNATQAGQAQGAAPGQAAADPRFAGQAAAGAQAGGVSNARSTSLEATGLKLRGDRKAVIQQLGDALRTGGWDGFVKLRAEISDRYNLDARQTLDLGTLTAGEVGPLYDLEHAKAFPFKAGRIAYTNSQAPIAPDGLSPEQASEWMAGWDDGASREPEARAARPSGEVVGEARIVGEQPQLDAPSQQPAPAQTIPARKKARQHPPTVRGSGALAEVSRALGGISPDLLADLSEKVSRTRTSKTGKATKYTSWDNPAIPGVGPLFRKGGTGDMAEVARVLEEAGYLEAGANERDPIGAAQRAQEIIRGELRKGGSAVQVGNADAIDAEMRARLNAEMEAAMDAESDPWDDFSFTPDDLDESGYADLNPELQSEVERLIAEADQAGLDSEAIREDVARQVGEEASQDEYNAAVKEAIQGLLPRVGRATEQAQPSRPQQGDRDGIEAAGDPSQEGSRGRGRQGGSDREALTLEAQTEEDLRAKAEREDAAAKQAAADKAAEQERLRRADEARDNKARADATVDDFQLGQSAEQQMSGMDDLFGTPAKEVEAAQVSADELRLQLRSIEDRIVGAAGLAPGFIEDAMRSRKVPVPLKEQRNALRQQIRDAQGRVDEARANEVRGPDAAPESASSDITPEEAARYLKDFVYSLNQLDGMTDRAQVLLSSPLGKSGRDNLLMEAFGLTREQAHDINNRLDARKPQKLRTIDMQDAFDVFPSLRKMVYDAIQQAQAKDQQAATGGIAGATDDGSRSAPTKPAPTESPNAAGLEAIFEGLQGRGLKKKNATEAAKAHPLAERITLVDKHILDILSDLDDSGTIKINC